MTLPELLIETNPKGFPVGSRGGFQLHSRFDPRREAERLAASPGLDEADLVILLGFGLGYAVEALAERQPARQVLVLEPDSQALDQAWEARNASAQPLAFPPGFKLELAWPAHADALIGRLQEAGSRNPAFIANPAMAKLCPAMETLCREALALFRQRSAVNVNTLAKFGHLWVRNLARNLEAFARTPGVGGLFGRFEGLPGLLLAGGPSLDHCLPELPALRERLLLVAVDTSLAACLRAGVDPDLVVMVDPQYWNTRHLDPCRASRALVVAESSVFPRSLRLTDGPLRFCGSLFPLGQFFEARLGEKGALGAGGSVATTAWDLLRQLGCRPIYCAGLDLSFPGGQTHFQGSVFEEATHRDARRLRPAAQARWHYLAGAGAYPVPDDQGGSVLSDQRMDVYAHWFENQFRSHPDSPTRRIGSGSRAIAGLGRASLEECLALPPIRGQLDERLAACRNSPSPPDWPERLSQARGDLRTQLDQLGGLVGEASALSARLLAQDQPEAAGLARLDAIDAALIGLADNRIIGFLVERLIQDLSTAEPPKDLREAIERSHRLYGALHEAARYHARLYA